ncbi:HAD-IA family hydrolase [Lachnospiraceae bacterium WCA-9-b2]|uniref:HAD-IA family hydrolase n=1 Tax=Sporofaciens musculi TaxID=2681861 RepID=A0A7X3ME66_9FIRM|nr:HAD family hydrolase [Sporofaciens musculi]MXP74776.1 HAD-IA family hydrolase [Sporofaciens musculi]
MIEVSNILEVEKYIDDLEAVVFDLDDTLYSERQYVRSGYRKIADYFGCPEIENEMWNVFEAGGKAIDNVLEKHGFLSKKNEALHIYRSQKPDIVLYQGVSEMIERIKKNKKVGIITDGRPEGQRAKLKMLDIVVDRVIVTDELGGIEFRKPNPRGFRLMMKELEVDFSKACYVGDNISKDFIAPQKLGMRCIWFRNRDGIYNWGERK